MLVDRVHVKRWKPKLEEKREADVTTEKAQLAALDVACDGVVMTIDA